MNTEEIKNELVANITEFMTDTAKDAVVVWLKDTALPQVQTVADSYTAELKKSAETETGWNKFRDGIFLPGLISFALWGFGKLLDKMAPEETGTVAADNATVNS